MSGVSILRGNTDPICASTGFRDIRFFGRSHAKILGGSGSFQPYNKLCGYNNYLPMFLGADYLNTGGFNMIKYCVPSTIGFLGRGSRTMFNIGPCSKDVSSWLSSGDSTINLCGCSFLDNFFGGGGSWFANPFLFLGGSGSSSSGTTSTSWSPWGISTATADGASILGSSSGVKSKSFGRFYSVARNKDGDYAKSYLGGLYTKTRNGDSTNKNFNGAVELLTDAVFYGLLG